jgi:predicted ATPase
VLRTLAISGYRSLRDIVLPLGPLTVVTGPNGSGKSNLYRALRLLQETAMGGSVGSLAREGGLASVLWAGPEEFGRAVRQGRHKVESTVRKNPVSLRVGFAGDDLSYSVEFGHPYLPRTSFHGDAEIKREAIWAAPTWQAGAAVVDRVSGLVRARDEDGTWAIVAEDIALNESMLTEIADPRRAPAALVMRDRLRSWRFYDGFRTDADAPVRQAQVGTRTPVLSNDGRDLASALQTIREMAEDDPVGDAVQDAFPGAQLTMTSGEFGRIGIGFQQHGLLRALSQAELSDGTLRYLLWIAVLLTPRTPSLMVLNEPETSLHPDLLPALGRLIAKASERGQVWVVTHSTAIREAVERAPGCVSI